jgi:bifunctional NMN adenylyltransferase/nudix hydrolase
MLKITELPDTKREILFVDNADFSQTERRIAQKISNSNMYDKNLHNMKDAAEVAVIVARFQTPYLHDGHREILDYVTKLHPRVLVFLGVTPLKPTKNDPMDFNARRAMIEEAYSNIEVLKINDMGDNGKWSRALDREISTAVGPDQSVVLYGSRDSFIRSYSGRYKTESLKPSRYISATEVRKRIGVTSQKNQSFREGVVWAMQNQFPKCHPTVDMVPINLSTGDILMVRKPEEDKLRFAGGFADPKSSSYEEDAIRELDEETTLKALSLEYIGSTIVDDWRYRSQIDKIKTSFFAVTKWTGEPVPSDDLAGGECRWINLREIKEEDIVVTHRPLLKMLAAWILKIDAAVRKYEGRLDKTV